MRTRRLLLLLVAGFLLSSCATQNAPPATPAPAERPIPAYLTAAISCVVVVGGIVPEFSDAKVANFWWRVGEAVTMQVYESLSPGHRVVLHMVTLDQQARFEHAMSIKMAQNRCNRLIQVATQVNEDSEGRYFGWSVSVFRLEPRTDVPQTGPGTRTITRGEFQKFYRYTRSEQTLMNFNFTEFADQLMSDLTASGALAPIRK